MSAAGHEAAAIEGGRSQYDVVADGRLVFSKQRVGRFPDDGEVEQLVAALASEPG